MLFGCGRFPPSSSSFLKKLGCGDASDREECVVGGAVVCVGAFELRGDASFASGAELVSEDSQTGYLPRTNILLLATVQLGRHLLGFRVFLCALLEQVWVVGAQTVYGKLPTLLAVDQVRIQKPLGGRLILGDF